MIQTRDEMNIISLTPVGRKWPISFESQNRPREEGELCVLVLRVWGRWKDFLFRDLSVQASVSHYYILIYFKTNPSCGPHLQGRKRQTWRYSTDPRCSNLQLFPQCSRDHQCTCWHTHTHTNTQQKPAIHKAVGVRLRGLLSGAH